MLKEKITNKEIKIIFSNKEYKLQYIKLFCKKKKKSVPKLRTNIAFDEYIIYTWEYDFSKLIIREIYKSTEKYANSKKCGKQIEKLRKRWSNVNLGEFEWPFQAMAFDQYVHGINNSNLNGKEKDKKLANDVIKFRRIKEINAKRNDYIEYLIFENNDDIIPTLQHRRGVDFYINGLPFDQKVSRSVSKKFIKKYGENFRDTAIGNPALVAECLYSYQDEERFGDEPRLFIIYLDMDLSLTDIKNSLNKVKFNEPYKIKFDYTHSNNVIQQHDTYCYVILLHKKEKTD